MCGDTWFNFKFIKYVMKAKHVFIEKNVRASLWKITFTCAITSTD